MAAEDWIPDFYDMEDELEPQKLVCKTCGKEGLQWGIRKTNGKDKWVLEESNGRKHKCKRIDRLKRMFDETT